MSEHVPTERPTLRHGSRRVWSSRRSGQEWGLGTWSEQGPLPPSALGTRKDQQRHTGVPSGSASRTLRCDTEKGGLLHLTSLQQQEKCHSLLSEITNVVVCVCVRVCTHIYISVYVYEYVYLCVHVCVNVTM